MFRLLVGSFPLLPHFLFQASFSTASWERQGPKERGLHTAPWWLPNPVCIFLLPCLSSLSCPPYQLSEPFLHQSKEWPQGGVKRVPPVAVGQPCATGRFKFPASCDWSISFGKKLSQRFEEQPKKGSKDYGCVPSACLAPTMQEMCSSLVSCARLGPFQSSPQEPAYPGLPPC